MIQIYTGNGKGKTTAALGLALRSLGSGKKICLIQFMKKNFLYGEIKALRNFENIDIFQFGTAELVDPNNPRKIDFEEAKKALKKSSEVIQSQKYDLIILDEINVAVEWNLISLEDQLQIFQIKTSSEIVMTGRYARKEALEKADLVTEMKEIKHYYQKGIQVRKGIEF